MRWFRGVRRIPPVLKESLAADEHVLAACSIEGGGLAAASRHGFWLVGDTAEQVPWHLISKARLVDRTLALTVADEVDSWPDGTVILQDRPELTIELERSSKLTDVVHNRVSRSVAASRQVRYEGHTSWVVLRRVAGRNGLTVQIRPDHGSSPPPVDAAELIAQVVDQIWPPDVLRADSGGGESTHGISYP